MDAKTLSSADEFVKALATHAPQFQLRLSDDDIARLRLYYELTMRWNARLHLVAPCTPAEFATRHVLESLLALPYLRAGARLVDVGSGAGLPAIPCLVARPDVSATLVESSAKKAVFLREALRGVGRREQGSVVVERFEKIDAPEGDVLTCRAVERFTEILPALLAWSAKISTLILYGGHTLRQELERAAVVHESLQVPLSERRFLFVVERA